MAHRIESTDGLVLVGERAWHGLGVVVPREAGMTVREGFRRAVPWDPTLVPLYRDAPVGKLTIPDAQGVVARLAGQAGAPDRYLATVSRDYSLVTHEDVIGLAEMVEDRGAKLETVGTTHGGRKLFLLLKVGQYGVGLIRADETSTYLALLNSFDGSTAFRGFGTEVRVVCANTYSAALGAADSAAVGFRIAHTGDLTARVAAAGKALAAGRLQLAALEAEARAMAARQIDVRTAGEYFARVAAILYPAVAAERPADKREAEAWDRQRARARETVSAWVAELEHERQALVAGTLYAAHEAVTHWADHGRPRVREHAADCLIGRGAAIKLQARRAALAMLK